MQVLEVTRGVSLLDYLAFTIVDGADAGDVMGWLGLDFSMLAAGQRGYRAGARGVGCPAFVLWDGGAPGMGVHVVLSGQVLRTLERSEGFAGWQRFLCDWIERGARFTRVDCAVDDREGLVDFGRVLAAVENGDLASKARAGSYVYHRTVKDGQRYQTVTLGSRQSERFFRCYEKSFDRGDSFEGLRFELELKGGYAQAVAHDLALMGLDIIPGVLAAFVDFKGGDGRDTCITRRKRAGWWSALLESASHVLEVTREVSRSLVKRHAHLVKQWSQTMFVLVEAGGGSVDWLYDAIEVGRSKLSRHNRDLLRAALAGGVS